MIAAEDVDPALVEIIAKRRYEVARLTDKYPENWPTWERLAQEKAALTVAFREAFLNGARGDLAAVLPEIQAQALRDAAREQIDPEDADISESICTADDIEAGAALMRRKVLDRAARLTATTEEPTDV